MSDLSEDAGNVAGSSENCPTLNDAIGIYMAINKPELKSAIDDYAAFHRISRPVAIAEACRAYFIGE